MNATLQNGDNLVVERVSYYFHEPRRYDIVVFRVPDDERKREHYIKRVIGLPGETVEISGGKVWIDGAVLEDDVYGKEAINRDFGPMTVPEGEVFVLGDNRNDSRDSTEIPSAPSPSMRGVTRTAYPVLALWYGRVICWPVSGAPRSKELAICGSSK